MNFEVCRHCHGARLVGWSGAGPHFCRECSRDVTLLDAFDVITQAWREEHHEVLRLRERLQFDPGGSDRIDELEQACIELRASNESMAMVPVDVHERGWQWRQTDKDAAFAPPFGTIRQCRGCGCLVAGGPTACVRCAEAGA